MRAIGLSIAICAALALWLVGGAGPGAALKACPSASQTMPPGEDSLRGDDNPATPGKYGKEVARADTLTGGPGDDSLRGFRCGDTLRGGEGADYLVGGNGNDVIRGGPRSDHLLGADGNDKLYADAGAPGGGCKGDECDADILFGGDGKDLLVGKAGHDTFDGGKGFDRCLGNAGDRYLPGCEVRGGKKRRRYSDTEQPPPPPTATTLNVAVNHNKDLVHLWGTTTPHAGSDTVYLVVQAKGASGDWGRVKWGCFGFGGDGRFQHDFALPPADNYRAQARYGDPECPAVAYGHSEAALLFNLK